MGKSTRIRFLKVKPKQENEKESTFVGMRSPNGKHTDKFEKTKGDDDR